MADEKMAEFLSVPNFISPTVSTIRLTTAIHLKDETRRNIEKNSSIVLVGMR